MEIFAALIFVFLGLAIKGKYKVWGWLSIGLGVLAIAAFIAQRLHWIG